MTKNILGNIMRGMGEEEKKTSAIGAKGSRLANLVKSGKITREQAGKFVSWIKKRIIKDNKKTRIKISRFKIKWTREHKLLPDFEDNKFWYMNKFEEDKKVFLNSIPWGERLDECFEEIEKSKKILQRISR